VLSIQSHRSLLLFIAFLGSSQEQTSSIHAYEYLGMLFVEDSDVRGYLWEPYCLDFARILDFPSFGYPFAAVLADDNPRPFN
ncbi:hypothetical protein A2U01_0088177, partial [Trifolium medium]|nr:hypothetical protein [Trifolium medium]